MSDSGSSSVELREHVDITAARMEGHLYESRDDVDGAEKGSGLRTVFFHRRPLSQYIRGDTLIVKNPHMHIAYDELFFDLVAVSNIVVLGDNLRQHFEGWPQIEHFILLYGALFFIWRETTLLWNALGSTKRDAFEKLLIALLMTCLLGIGVSVERAFVETTRVTAACAFAGLAINSLVKILYGILLSSPVYGAARLDGIKPWRNALTGNGIVTILCSLPYLVAAVIPDSQQRKVRILFWSALIANIIRSIVYQQAFAMFNTRHTRATVIPACNVHALSERYGLITLISIGEAFTATILEGSRVKTDVRVLFASFLGLVLTYSLHTLYFDVDNHLARGDIHALERGRVFAALWTLSHIPLHVCVVLSASALGIFIERSATTDSEAAADVVRAEIEEMVEMAASHSLPSSAQIWLLCSSYAGALLMLLFISRLHKINTMHHSSYHWRSCARIVVICVLVTAVAIPADGTLSTVALLSILSTMIGSLAFGEFLLTSWDSYRWRKSAEYKRIHAEGVHTDPIGHLFGTGSPEGGFAGIVGLGSVQGEPIHRDSKLASTSSHGYYH